MILKHFYEIYRNYVRFRRVPGDGFNPKTDRCNFWKVSVGMMNAIKFFQKIFSFTKSCYFCNALRKTSGFLKY